MKTEKTPVQHIIEVTNSVQKLRLKGCDFDSISDKLIEQNVELDVRLDAIDTVKRQEKNRDKFITEVQKAKIDVKTWTKDKE
jgi:uncharacterized protein YPO0396